MSHSKLGFDYIRRIAPALGPLVLFALAAELAVEFNWVASYILPPPSDVLRSLIDDRSELWSGFFETASAAGIGLVLSFIVGTCAAALLSLSETLRRAFYPYAVFFQTVPIIAIAPLLVIWFGFGSPTVIASAFIVSVFPVVASTLLGLQSTDPALIDLFRLYSASRFMILRKLKIPHALPFIFSGLRIAAGLAVIGAIVGEFIAGTGLGSVVDGARTQQRVDKVFAAVLMSSFLGLILVGVINFSSRALLRHWHSSEGKFEKRI